MTPIFPMSRSTSATQTMSPSTLAAIRSNLVINLSDPSDYLDVSRFPESRIGTAISGSVGYDGKGVNFGLLIHSIRRTEDGCEMRSRFWLGDIEITWLRQGAHRDDSNERRVARDQLPAVELHADAALPAKVVRKVHDGRPKAYDVRELMR